jgi:hypothetical protein
MPQKKTFRKAYRVSGIPVHKWRTHKGRAARFKQPVNFTNGISCIGPGKEILQYK